jgi:hypothetical protein
MFFKVLGNWKPCRLFVAGVHGNEEAITLPFMELMAKEIEVANGRLITIGLPGGYPYISTLNKEYYDSINGRKLLYLVRKYKPSIYLELHSYRTENHSKLTDPERKKKIGVPPFTDLEEKVLMGSVSPLIRTTEFNMEDFCLTLEIPDPYSEKALHVALDIMNVIALSSSRYEIIGKLRGKYPEQIREAEKNFHEFFREINHPSFF